MTPWRRRNGQLVYSGCRAKILVIDVPMDGPAWVLQSRLKNAVASFTIRSAGYI